MRDLEEVTKFRVATVQRLLASRELSLTYVVILLLWGCYRLLFRLPVWFEELGLKAVIFGLPVYLTAKKHQWQWKELGMTGVNLTVSVYLGIMLGIILGLVGNLGNLMRYGKLSLSAFGLTGEALGGFIILSLVTAFWEQLLFCGLFQKLVSEVGRDEWWQAWVVTILFVTLHLPALVFVQRLTLIQLGVAVITLVLLQLGNVVLMLRWRNLAAPLMAQALWGITVFMFR